MNEQLLFTFKTDISKINIPSKLNNPFGTFIPEIAKIAATEFQEFIALESGNWNHDLLVRTGKMFGVLVVKKRNGSYGYLATVSGQLSGKTTSNKFTPAVFNEAANNFYFDKGMANLTAIGKQIKNSTNQLEIATLKEKRKQKSIGLQQFLFENSHFLNVRGLERNALEVFELSSNGKPPSAAGECAAPKMLQYAFKHDLKPIAVAEFWWGNSGKDNKKTHLNYYPACKTKCRPILEYMLDDTELYIEAMGAKG